MAKQNLPTLSQLHQSPAEAFKNDQLKLLLNQEPHESFIKKHPVHGNKYVPIDKIEWMLDRIFQEWKVEVLREGSMFNSVYCTIRLHYKNPVTGEWTFHDGVGAKSCQLDAGSKASAMENIKMDAVGMALPIAKSVAIRDAADHIGKIFGRDLNRKNTLNFKGAYSVETETQKEEDNNYKSTNLKPINQDEDLDNIPL